MKKIVVAVTTLVGVLAMGLPVMAASPTATTALTPVAQTTQTSTTLTGANAADAQAMASSLLSSGAVETAAAATAVADSLVSINAANTVDTAALSAQCNAIYAGYTAEQRAAIDAAASKRGISAAEAIGNYIAADPAIPGSTTIAWSPNLSRSSIDGKAGSINIILSKPSAQVIADAVKDAGGKPVLGVIDPSVEGGKNFKTLDTAFNVDGIRATDTADTIIVKQLVNGKWIKVKITGFANGGLSLHLTNKGPIKIERIA